MRQFILFATVVLTLTLFVACGSNNENSQNSMQKAESMEPVHKEWIRTEPIDVKASDLDNDGYVYQDQMDWNVIADEEGKCPLCDMTLKKVTIEAAIANLKDNGYTTKE